MEWNGIESLWLPCENVMVCSSHSMLKYIALSHLSIALLNVVIAAAAAAAADAEAGGV